MSPITSRDPGGDGVPARDALVEELESRIKKLESLDDEAIGRFTRWDWLLCVIGSLVFPAVAMWWFAG